MRVHAFSFLGGALLFATIAASLPARAELSAVTVAAKADTAAPITRASRAPEINLAFGVRSMIIPSAGLDPFSSNNALTQVSLAAGPTLWRSGAVSFAALVQWDFGRLADRARGAASELAIHRLGVGLESRLQLARRLALFAKIAPAAVHASASIADAGADQPLVSRSWSWALDTTAGAALMFASTGPRAAPTSRWWFTGELGYGFAGESAMLFKPEADAEDPRTYGAITLPALRPAGALLRFAAAVSF
jgi:hypothetical protein